MRKRTSSILALFLYSLGACFALKVFAEVKLPQDTPPAGPTQPSPDDSIGEEMGGAKPQPVIKDEASSECARLTAPQDLKEHTNPANFATINWEHAVAICEKALDAHPDEPHLQYGLAFALFQTKHYVEANQHYRIAADAGLPIAQNELGKAYHFGFGTVKNDQKAFELWSKAAEAGWPPSIGNIAAAYSNGLYVQKDPVKALEWNEKAIEAGNVTALGNLGLAYLSGAGVERDFATAAQYFQQGADLGNGFALKSLANMYEAGFMGAPQPDKAGALRLLAQQQDPGSPDGSPLSVYKAILAESRKKTEVHHAVHRRRYVYYRPYRFYGTCLLAYWC